MVTPGRSRIRFADNVNAKPGEYLPSVQTNVWVDLNTRTGRPERQARGGNVRVAGLTRIEDLECAELVKSEEHTSELQSLMRSSYAVLCFKNRTATPLRSSQRRHRGRG